MKKVRDFTKPPKFLMNFFHWFRKWKLSRYKKKKVREEKSLKNRTYFLKFIIKIDDPLNPQESEVEYEMVIPAKAAFFAKQKARKAVEKKLRVYFSECEMMTDEEVEHFSETEQEYIDVRMEELKENHTKPQ